MKRKLAIMTSVGLAAGLVSGCGGGGNAGGGQTTTMGGGSAPPASNVQSLTTQDVLAQAKAPSEIGSPYMVNGGLLVLTDTSETSAPITVDGM